MSQKHEIYIKPAVLRLEYQDDLTVRMQNCKTTGSAGPSTPEGCGAGTLTPCNSIGS